MERIASTPRSNRVERCEEVGFYHHTHPPVLAYLSGDTKATEPSVQREPYWWEDAYYLLSVEEAEALAEAAIEAVEIIKETFDHVALDSAKLAQLLKVEAFPAGMLDTVAAEYLAQYSTSLTPLTYRVRLAWDSETGSPVLLNVYPSSPFGMAEQQGQQAWSEDMFLLPRQFATLDTAIVEELKIRYSSELDRGATLHIIVPTEDDVSRELLSALIYIQARAEEAGFTCTPLYWDAAGWDEEEGVWRDQFGKTIMLAYSIAPYQYLLQTGGVSTNGEILAAHPGSLTTVEPIWSSLLGSNLLLAAAWRQNKENPLLLETSVAPEPAAEENIQSFPLSAASARMLVNQAAAPYRWFGPSSQYAPEFDVWCIGDEDGNVEAVALSVREYEQTPGGLRSFAVPHQISE